MMSELFLLYGGILLIVQHFLYGDYVNSAVGKTVGKGYLPFYSESLLTNFVSVKRLS